MFFFASIWCCLKLPLSTGIDEYTIGLVNYGDFQPKVKLLADSFKRAYLVFCLRGDSYPFVSALYLTFVFVVACYKFLPVVLYAFVAYCIHSYFCDCLNVWIFRAISSYEFSISKLNQEPSNLLFWFGKPFCFSGFEIFTYLDCTVHVELCDDRFQNKEFLCAIALSIDQPSIIKRLHILLKSRNRFFTA